MVDNRYATALVIGSVLSLLATVYLSVAMGTQYWFQYSSPPTEPVNQSQMTEFKNSECEEKIYSKAMFDLNGTLGLWWRCIQPDSSSEPKMETSCVSFTLSQQFETKYQLSEKEDLLRTYLWRFQFLLPLVSLALVFLSGLVGVCACLCRSFTPTLGVGVLHFLAGLCSLGTICCFRVGVDLLEKTYPLPKGVEGSMGWSLYLALISFPLQMMAAALFLWAAKSHRKNYTPMVVYRVA
ncbi:claudin domain-containing protein 1-like isoform X2 [Kryptolebias marmoratus]|uniref:Claudin domain containing 1 n=1 Tax=Kryptolebias marmoratus TaxID=37003 RepID=A0A3Q2ZS41_KRYMA|nr:claudin domain-containing protein 1-like isoform X2 [Kryptolebias marmoratus]